MINAHLCTVKLSRLTVPGLENYRLDTLAGHFSVPILQRHRAGSDALATAQVFLHLLSRLEEHGITDLAAAQDFQMTQTKETEPIEVAEAISLLQGF
jgi:DNA polymerase III epsilon subunit-like protein